MSRYISQAEIDDVLGYELPDPPENPELHDLFTPEQVSEIDRRFQLGIERNERALYEARERKRKTEREHFERIERRKQREAAALAARFNPVLRSRP